MKNQQSLIAKLLRQHQEKQRAKYAEGGSAGARGRRDQVATDTGWDPSTTATKLGDWGKFMLNQLTTPLETVTGWEFYDPSFSETKFGQTTGKISNVTEGITGLATDVAGTAFLGPAYTAGKSALTAGFDMAGAEDQSSGQTFGALGGPVGRSRYAGGGHARRRSYQNGGPPINPPANTVGQQPVWPWDNPQASWGFNQPGQETAANNPPSMYSDEQSWPPHFTNLENFSSQGPSQAEQLRAHQNKTPNPTSMGPEAQARMDAVESQFNNPYVNQQQRTQQPYEGKSNIFTKAYDNLQGMSDIGQSDFISGLAGTGRIANDSEGQAAGIGDALGKLSGPSLAQKTKAEARDRGLKELDRPATVYDSHGNIVGNQDPTAQMKTNFQRGRNIGRDTFGKIGSGLKMAGDLYANSMAPAEGYGGLEGMGKVGDFFTADNMKNLSNVAGSFFGKGELGGGVGSSIGNFYGGVNAAFLANRDDGKHLGYGYNSGGQPPKKYGPGDEVKKEKKKNPNQPITQFPWGEQLNSRQRKFSDAVMEGKDWTIEDSHKQMTTIPYDPKTQMEEFLKAQKLYDDSLRLHGFTLDQLDLEGGVYKPKEGDTIDSFKGDREKHLRSGSVLGGGLGLLYGYSDTWKEPLEKGLGDYGTSAINWVKDAFGVTPDTVEEKIESATDASFVNPETLNKERYGPRESMYHKTNIQKADKLGLTGEARDKFLKDEYNKTYVDHLKRNSRLTEGDPNFSWAEEIPEEGDFTDFSKTDFSSDLMHKNMYPAATYLSGTGFYNPVYAPPVHRPWLSEFDTKTDVPVKEETVETEEVKEVEEVEEVEKKDTKDYPIHYTKIDSDGKVLVPRTYKGQTPKIKGIKKQQAMGGNIRKYGPGATVTRAQIAKERIDSPQTSYIDPNYIDPNFLIHPDLQNNNLFDIPQQIPTRGSGQRVSSGRSGINNQLLLNNLQDAGKYQINPFLQLTPFRQGADVQKEGVTTLPITPAGALDVPQGFQGYFPIPGGEERSHESGNDIPMITPAEMQGRQEILVEGGESAEVKGGETFIFPKGKFKRRADKLNREKDRIIKKLSNNEIKTERGNPKFDDIMIGSLEKALANNETAMNALKEEVIETKQAKEQQQGQQQQGQLMGAMMGGMNPQMMAEGAGVIAPASYLQAYREGRQNTEDWWDRVSTGDLKPINYYEGVLEQPIQYMQDAVNKTLSANQREQENRLTAKSNAQQKRIDNYVNSAPIQDARSRALYATEADKMRGIDAEYNKMGLQYDTRIGNLMAQQGKLEAAGEEKLNKTMLDLFGDYKTARAEDIDELPEIVANTVKNEEEARKNSALREAMIGTETGFNPDAYKVDPATGNIVAKTQAEIENEKVQNQPPQTGTTGTTTVVEEETEEVTEETPTGGKEIPDPFEDPLYNDFGVPTDEEIISGVSKTPLEREREARGYGPHVTDDDLNITDAMTDFEVESGATQPILDDQGNPTGEYEAVGIESYGTPKARKDILEDYMGYASFTDQYGKSKMGIKGLVPNYDDLDYNIKGLLAEYNLNMGWDPRVLILRATGFDDKTTNYHQSKNKAAFEKLWRTHGNAALKRLANEDKTFTEDVLENLVRERNLIIDGTFDNKEDADAFKAKGMKSPKLYPSTSLRKERWAEGWDAWAI